MTTQQQPVSAPGFSFEALERSLKAATELLTRARNRQEGTGGATRVANRIDSSVLPDIQKVSTQLAFPFTSPALKSSAGQARLAFEQIEDDVLADVRLSTVPTKENDGRWENFSALDETLDERDNGAGASPTDKVETALPKANLLEKSITQFRQQLMRVGVEQEDGMQLMDAGVAHGSHVGNLDDEMPESETTQSVEDPRKKGKQVAWQKSESAEPSIQTSSYPRLDAGSVSTIQNSDNSRTHWGVRQPGPQALKTLDSTPQRSHSTSKVSTEGDHESATTNDEVAAGGNEGIAGKPLTGAMPHPGVTNKDQNDHEDQFEKQIAVLEKLHGRMHSLNRDFMRKQRGIMEEQTDAVQNQTLKQMQYLQDLHDRQSEWQISHLRRMRGIWTEEAETVATTQQGMFQNKENQSAVGVEVREFNFLALESIVIAQSMSLTSEVPQAQDGMHRFTVPIPAESDVRTGPVREAESSLQVEEQLASIRAVFAKFLSEYDQIRNIQTEALGENVAEESRRRSTLLGNTEDVAAELRGIQQRMGWSPLDNILEERTKRRQRDSMAAARERTKNMAELVDIRMIDQQVSKPPHDSRGQNPLVTSSERSSHSPSSSTPTTSESSTRPAAKRIKSVLADNFDYGKAARALKEITRRKGEVLGWRAGEIGSATFGTEEFFIDGADAFAEVLDNRRIGEEVMRQIEKIAFNQTYETHQTAGDLSHFKPPASEAKTHVQPIIRGVGTVPPKANPAILKSVVARTSAAGAGGKHTAGEMPGGRYEGPHE
ncbi:hypothetical protein HK104_007081 [Borealophlyctis nickersoniae]|nr:hypothetical protein HK104_007081 [Borealophlyctis nickersoniae]